ncbi:hypothetical protein [Streptomyces sp. NPDC059008]
MPDHQLRHLAKACEAAQLLEALSSTTSAGRRSGDRASNEITADQYGPSP